MIILDNVSYRYKGGTQDVLKNVFAFFERGKTHAILGPSGCGKTTLLSIIAGLDRPASGTVLVDGDDLTGMDLDKYRRERVSMVFQAFQLFPLLTAIENVCVPMMLKWECAEAAGAEPRKPLAKRKTHGPDSRRLTETWRFEAKQLLYSVGIDDSLHNRYPSNLSGGEQQRVAIARALSGGAKIILADEPTGNLDVANGEEVFSILKRIAHEGDYCVIVVTHNLEVADACDTVYIMSDGKLSRADDGI